MNENRPIYKFKDRKEWWLWLRSHHDTNSEAWLLIQKKHSTSPGLSLDEAVEEALCFGWIDGVLNTRDSQSYLLRFSPRKPNSVWSMRNIQRVERLQQRGKMTDAGLKEVQNAKENGQWQSAIDRENIDIIPPDLASTLRRKKGAIAAYRALPDSKKKMYLYWLQSAKREVTRRKRIDKIIKETTGVP
jgi:uncharacterized protein YdeI (YjbR/CyaY-like superfamily)